MLDHTAPLEQLILVCGHQLKLVQHLRRLRCLAFVRCEEWIAQSLLDVAGTIVPHFVFLPALNYYQGAV